MTEEFKQLGEKLEELGFKKIPCEHIEDESFIHDKYHKGPLQVWLSINRDKKICQMDLEIYDDFEEVSIEFVESLNKLIENKNNQQQATEDPEEILP